MCTHNCQPTFVRPKHPHTLPISSVLWVRCSGLASATTTPLTPPLRAKGTARFPPVSGESVVSGPGSLQAAPLQTGESDTGVGEWEQAASSLVEGVHVGDICGQEPRETESPPQCTHRRPPTPGSLQGMPWPQHPSRALEPRTQTFSNPSGALDTAEGGQQAQGQVGDSSAGLLASAQDTGKHSSHWEIRVEVQGTENECRGGSGDLGVVVTHTKELRAACPKWCCCQADTCPRDSMPGELKPCRADRSALVSE